MKYDYQDDNMEALRLTFEEMIDEIADLRSKLSEADDSITELYHEANDLERELRLLRERYDQDMFDAQEDMIELERSYNSLVDDYNALYDAATEAVVDPDFDDDQWDIFEVSKITIN